MIDRARERLARLQLQSDGAQRVSLALVREWQLEQLLCESSSVSAHSEMKMKRLARFNPAFLICLVRDRAFVCARSKACTHQFATESGRCWNSMSGALYVWTRQVNEHTAAGDRKLEQLQLNELRCRGRDVCLAF